VYQFRSFSSYKVLNWSHHNSIRPIYFSTLFQSTFKCCCCCCCYYYYFYYLYLYFSVLYIEYNFRFVC
jgi:hypothetical protein